LQRSGAVGARSLDELRAFQAARAFKLAAYAVLYASAAATRDFRFAEQLRDSASSGEANVAEGFGRFSRAEFRRFLTIARSSIMEAVVRLQDGIDRGYFSEKDIADARSKGDYALRLITALRSSLDR
jgi:four helix bundle protein